MADAVLRYRVSATDDGAVVVFKKVGDELTKVDKRFTDTGKGAKKLGDQIEDTKKRLANLNDTFKRTGDVSILKDISKTEKTLSRLSAWQKRFGDDTDTSTKKMSVFGRVGVMAGNGMNVFATASTNASGAMKMLLSPVGLAAVAIGSVAAGAVVSGAALAGLGLGIVGLGAIALRNSQHIKNALTDMGATVDGVGARSAKVLESDFVGALNTLKGTAERAEPSLTRMFTTMAPSVGKLAAGLDGLVAHSLPGLEKGAEGANRVLGMLGDELPAVGDVVSDLGLSLNAASEGGGKALIDTLTVLGDAVRFVGASAVTTSKAYEFLSIGSNNLGGILEILRGKQDAVNDSAKGGVIGLTSFAASANMAKAAVEAEERANTNLAESLKDISNLALSLAGSEIAAIDARHRMVEVLKDGAKSLDVNTDAGRRNKESILAGVTAAIRFGEAETKRTGSSVAGAAAQQRHTDAMYANAVATLKDKAAVDKLWASLGLLPPAKAPKVSAPGAKAATTEVANLEAKIKALRDRSVRVGATVTGEAQTRNLNNAIARLHNRTVFITTVRRTVGALDRESLGLGGFSKGGINLHKAQQGLVHATTAPPGTMFQWAEPQTGGEAFIPRRGDRSRSTAILGEAASWYDMAVVPAAPSRAPSGVGVRTAAPIVINNYGPIGSSKDLDWFVAMLDRARRKARA